MYSNAGQVRKSFSIKAHAGGTGYFFNLSKYSFIMKLFRRIMEVHGHNY